MTFLVSTNPIVTISGSTPIAATEGVTPTISIQDSTINQKGAVQLEDSVVSTSIVKAATPNSVREAYDYATTTSGNLQSDINSKSDIDHSHIESDITDLDKYTQDEVDSLLTTISGKLDDHNELNNLDYASSGHTGFQPAGDYLTDSEFSTYSGTLQSQIDEKSDIGHSHDDQYYTESEVDTISGSLANEINTKDNYSNWSFAVDGVTKDAITSSDILNFVGGENINITRSAEDEITISGGSGVIDHGALTGLEDDDHAQYLLRDDFTTYSGGLQSQIDDKSELTHLHDDRYYTESEVDDLITTISGKLDDHNELNNLDYSSSGHTGFQPAGNYLTESEIDTISGTLQTNIDGKADIGHLHDDRYYTELETDTISGVLNTKINSKPDTLLELSDTPGVYDANKYLRSTVDGAEWTAVSGTGGTSIHSELSNLAYADAGHTGFASSTALSTTSGSLQTEIDNKSDIGHTHDNRYYTESEVDTISGSLDAKIPDTIIDLSDTPNVYDAGKYLRSTVDGTEWATVSGGTGTFIHSDLSNLAYADSGHTGFTSSAELLTTSGSLQAGIDEKADTVHTHDDRYYIESEVDTISGALNTKIDSKPDILLDLSDTPAVYDTGKYLRSTTTGVEWSTVSGVGSSDVQTFLDLTDTPTTYSGHAGNYLKVSLDESELEYADTQGTATTTVSGWSVFNPTTYYADFEHNLSTEDIAVFVIDTATNKEVGVEDVEILNGNTVRVYITDNTSSLKINVITGGFGTSQTGVSPDHVIYVAKNGSDVTETGGINNPFLTIEAANDYAISLLNPIPDWEECVVIKVAPGKYTEHLTNAHRRVYIVSDVNEFEGWPKDVVIYNTGADEAHYPIDVSQWLNLVGIEVKVDTGGVYGRLINKGIYSSCVFTDGYFINNPDVGWMSSYFNFCAFSGDGFKLEGTNNGAFIAFRRCDLGCANTVFGTTVSGSSNTMKLHSSMCSSDTTISGNWSLLMQTSELYGDGALTFDTDGYIDIYNSIISNGAHFVSDTSEHKKVIGCYFKDIINDADITADVNIIDVEYSGNHQDKGINGEIKITDTTKNIGPGIEDSYRNLVEAVKASTSGDVIKLGVGTYEENIIVPDGVSLLGMGRNDTILTSASGITVTLSGTSNLNGIGIHSTVSGIDDASAVCVLGGTHSFSRCVVASTATDVCSTTIYVADGNIVLKGTNIKYNSLGDTTGSGIHRLVYLNGTAGIDFRDSAANMTITDANSLADASLFESTGSSAVETYLLSNTIKFDATNPLWGGNCFGYRAVGVGINRNILSNIITISGSGGTGDGYWYVLDTPDDNGEIHSSFNSIKVTGFANNYFGNMSEGGTLASYFDNLIADDGVMGDGIYSFVNSPSPGNLQMSGYMVNPYDNIVKVAKAGAQYTSVKDAVDSITDSNTNNRYVVTVGPGIYSENNPIQLKPWVSVQSLASKETTMIIAQNASSDLFIGCDRSFLNELALVGTTSGKLLNMSVSGEMGATNIVIVDGEYGIYIGHEDATINLEHLYAQTYFSTMKEAVTVVSGTLVLQGPIVLDSPAGPSTIETLVKGSGGSSHIIVKDLWSDSPNVTNGIYVDNGCDLVENSGYLKNVTYGMRIGSGGGSLDAASTRIKSSEIYDLWVESSSGVFRGYGCSINRDKLSIANDAGVRSSGYDPYADTFRTLGDFSVGMDGSGNISQFGEGGSHEYGVKIKTYDGSTYDTLTTQSGILFPNISTDSCIYVGSDNLFYGLKYNLTTAIDYGSGSIIYEYYDANGSWLEFNTMNTLQAYSDIVDIFTAPGEDYTLRFNQNIKSGVYESDVTASGITTTTVDGVNGYWVRCRIVSNITTSPEFTSIRAEGNYFIIRANGTRAYHGEARATQIKELIVGATSAGTADESLSISTNITFPYTQNKMAQVGADESVYGRFIIPSNCDTSCGLSYSYEFTNVASPSSDEAVHFKVTMAGISEIDKFDGSVGESVLDDSTITIAATDSAWSLYRRDSSKQFDLSVFKPGDVIYIKLQRMNDTPDTYGSGVCLSNHYIEYRSWQDGIQLKSD